MRDDMADRGSRDRMVDREVSSDASTPGGTESPRLVSLEEVKGEFKVAENDPDIRGWDVRTSDDVAIGKVDDLIVDTGVMKVRYMTVKIDGDVLGVDDDRHVLIPIGEARLDDDDDDVWLSIDSAHVVSLPEYDSSMFDRDYENSVRQSFTGTDTNEGTASATSGDYYAGENYDETRLFGNRRKGRENERYITLAEEQLAVNKREVSGGEARVRKTVEADLRKERIDVDDRENVRPEDRP